MQEFKKIGVVGAGQMGRGIAQVAAFAQYQVVMFDVSSDSLEFGHQFIKNQLDRGVEKEKWNRNIADETLSRITTTTNLTDLSDCDLVVEAATENKDIKLKIFKDLDQVVKKDAILASNTSSISLYIFIQWRIKCC